MICSRKLQHPPPLQRRGVLRADLPAHPCFITGGSADAEALLSPTRRLVVRAGPRRSGKGKQVKLVNGRDNEKRAYELFNELKAKEPEDVADMANLTVFDAFSLFIDWSRKTQKPATAELARHFLQSFIDHPIPGEALRQAAGYLPEAAPRHQLADRKRLESDDLQPRHLAGQAGAELVCRAGRPQLGIRSGT